MLLLKNKEISESGAVTINEIPDGPGEKTNYQDFPENHDDPGEKTNFQGVHENHDDPGEKPNPLAPLLEKSQKIPKKEEGLSSLQDHQDFHGQGVRDLDSNEKILNEDHQDVTNLLKLEPIDGKFDISRKLLRTFSETV